MSEPRLKVLFLCSKNQWRSPTAENIYRDDPRLEVRSAGVKSQARRRVNAQDLAWADVVFVMERGHKSLLLEAFQDLALPPIEVLEIPDDFYFMQPELLTLLRETIDPEIEARLKR